MQCLWTPILKRCFLLSGILEHYSKSSRKGQHEKHNILLENNLCTQYLVLFVRNLFHQIEQGYAVILIIFFLSEFDN